MTKFICVLFMTVCVCASELSVPLKSIAEPKIMHVVVSESWSAEKKDCTSHKKKHFKNWGK